MCLETFNQKWQLATFGCCTATVCRDCVPKIEPTNNEIVCPGCRTKINIPQGHDVQWWQSNAQDWARRTEEANERATLLSKQVIDAQMDTLALQRRIVENLRSNEWQFKLISDLVAQIKVMKMHIELLES